MIKVKLFRGGAYRVVIVKDRTISLITPELYNRPITINLDKIDEEKDKISKSNVSKEEIEKLKKLKSEEEIMEDVLSDFIKEGWEVKK